MDSGATSGPIRREHSPEEWEQQRALIKHLYIDQNKPLLKVMSEMEERGFYATTKLYKNWIKAWKLRKNLTLDQKKVLLQKERTRKMEEDKETVFWMNGDVIPLDRLLRHEKRQKEEERQNLLGVATPADTPSCVCYQTPPGGGPRGCDAPDPEISSSPQSLRSPNQPYQTIPCLACQRYEEFVACALKMDLQHQAQPPSLISHLDRWHDNICAIGSPRSHACSLQGPSDASSQSAIRAFMDLSDRFENIKGIWDEMNASFKAYHRMSLAANKTLPLTYTPMTPELTIYLEPGVRAFTNYIYANLEVLEAFAEFLRVSFDVQRHILLELVGRVKIILPQSPQEALRTCRELFCTVNNEDALRLKEVAISLKGLCEICAEKEISHAKNYEVLGFPLSHLTLEMLLGCMLLHYERAMVKVSLLQPWSQSDRAVTVREKIKFS